MFLGLYVYRPNLCLNPRMAFLPCVYVQISPFYKNASHAGLRAQSRLNEVHLQQLYF